MELAPILGFGFLPVLLRPAPPTHHSVPPIIVPDQGAHLTIEGCDQRPMFTRPTGLTLFPTPRSGWLYRTVEKPTADLAPAPATRLRCCPAGCRVCHCACCFSSCHSNGSRNPGKRGQWALTPAPAIPCALLFLIANSLGSGLEVSNPKGGVPPSPVGTHQQSC